MISTINVGVLERDGIKVHCAFMPENFCTNTCAAFDIKTHQGRKLVTCGRLPVESLIIGEIEFTGIKIVENDVIVDVSGKV
jgi:hypothetical protein